MVPTMKAVAAHLAVLVCGSRVVRASYLPSLDPYGDARVTAAFTKTASLVPTGCAAVDYLTSSLLAATPSATPTVPYSVALECLVSVPNKRESALRLVKSLKTYLQWQSTLTFLKDPPRDYYWPPTDLMAGLDDIASKVCTRHFPNEWEFGKAIYLLLSSAHDGHLYYVPDIFNPFWFDNDLIQDLTHVSVDGLEVPKLYHRQLLTNSSEMPPAVVKINGEDAVQVISRGLSEQFLGFQDIDAALNSQFESSHFPVNRSLWLSGSLIAIPQRITLTYDNGEERTGESYAFVTSRVNFTGIETGDDFYNRCCNPEVVPYSPSETPTTTHSPPAPTIDGYPWPVVRDDGYNLTAGYFLNGTGRYNDVAVLSITGFEPSDEANFTSFLQDFQKTVAKFLAACKGEKKTQLVIDLSTNGGGYIMAGYELFAQLFPGVSMTKVENLREHSTLVKIAHIANSFSEQDGLLPDDLTVTENKDGTLNITSSLPRQEAEKRMALSFLRHQDVGETFVPGALGIYSPLDGSKLTADAILDPVTILGDKFTAFQFSPFNETDPEFNMTGTGTGSSSHPPPAVFRPENIKGVKTIAIGGRPQLGPMQAIGETEGGQVFYFGRIGTTAAAALHLKHHPNHTHTNLPFPQNDSEEDLRLLAEGYAAARSRSRSGVGSVNGKDVFSRINATTPLQFLYQAANCRIFYTKEMLSNPDTVWKRATDATWTNPAKYCVHGSRVFDNFGDHVPTDELFVHFSLFNSSGPIPE
ncbi:peptidase S41 family protein [Podospora australis]|uniref:Peptidase S41 family protein n=1 Tax=Podospora australis TaxID=1536484 RepID=A0AAN7AES8_9PEZI|nr:peptidase S41 family protein [Podospora australis]